MGLLNRIRDPISGIAQVVGCDPPPTAALGMPCRVQLVVQGAGIAPFSVDQTVDVPEGKWPTQGQSLPVTFDRNHTDRLRIEWDQVGAGATPATTLPAMPTRAAPVAPTQVFDAPTPADPSHVEASTVVGTSVNGGPMQWASAMNSPQAKEAIARAEKMMNMDLDGDGTVAGAPAQPGQQMDLNKIMQQAQEQLAAFQQQGGFATLGSGGAMPTAPAGGDDTISKLEELAKLRDRGVLNDAEFEQQKKRILGET
jgi:Short C-terminal domain